jgi:hypothetical protein
MDTSRFGGRKSGIEERRKTADLQALWPLRLGQHCPSHCPTQPEAPQQQAAASSAEARLGKALDIREVAALIGCSPWNIRHRWIPQGLPHLRSGASSRLIFYEAQVVRWIERQQKGG